MYSSLLRVPEYLKVYIVPRVVQVDYKFYKVTFGHRYLKNTPQRERVPRKTLLDAPTSNVLYNTVSKSSPCTPRAHLEALRSRQDTGQALEVPETERPRPPATGAVTHGPRLSVCLRESPRGRRVRGACPPVSVDVWSRRLWASYPQQTRPACEKRWTCMGTSHVNAQAPLQGASRFGALSGDSNPGGGE